MESRGGGDSDSVLEVLAKAAWLVPVWHYMLGMLVVVVTWLYRFLEVHIVEDVVNGWRGNRVSLTFNSCSEIYEGVASKCRILHGRYWVTPWLSSPHLQTVFLNFFGRPPHFTYTRQLFTTPDGGTIAFDWLRPSHSHVNHALDITPIVLIIPGLMSDSSSAYIKHLAFKIAKSSWNVVVCNHRGLGGVSLTSEWFYNAGWTEDLRTVVDYLHQEYPIAPLFAVGTSIGANVLVKYLGEDGDNTHLAGAAAICSPWDLLVCDRFISRTLVQRFYSRAITTGLQVYAQTHQSIYSRLADWEGIRKSRFVRDFDNHATCILGKFETADTYYRHSSSAGYVKNVTVPLLCISALDDPVCTREAIPWDECRANKKVVLATTQHGGHLAFFEGFKASGLWWVRAVDEFFRVLHSSQFMHKQKEQTWGFAAEPVMDQVPYVSFTEDGMVSAMVDEETSNYMAGQLPQEEYVHTSKRTGDVISDSEQGIARQSEESQAKSGGDVLQLAQQHVTESEEDVKVVSDSGGTHVRKQLKELSRHSRRSMWLLAYIALITTWPVLGSTLMVMLKRKIRNVLLPAAWLRR